MLVQKDEGYDMPEKCPICGSLNIVEEGIPNQSSVHFPPSRIICADCGRVIRSGSDVNEPGKKITISRSLDSYYDLEMGKFIKNQS